MTTSTLRITLQDASRKPLEDVTRIHVSRARDRSLVAAPIVEFPDNVVAVQDLPPDTYTVRAFPRKHRPCGKFACPGQAVTLNCPVDASKVRAIEVRDAERTNTELGAVLHSLENLDRGELAGLLNVWSKLQTTFLVHERTLASCVHRITRVNPDRIWFEPSDEMLPLASESVDAEQFVKVSGQLHAFADWSVVTSFKTQERYGNLQVTFLRNGDGDLLVDADIDEASGIGHLFQVVRNALPGVSTNPFDIHQILTFHQELDVGYDLVV